MPLTDEDKRKIQEEEEFRAEVRARVESKNGCGNGCLNIFLAVMGTIVGLYAIAFIFLPAEAPRKPGKEVDRQVEARAKACLSPTAAIREAREAVKQSLKSPTSATFPGTFLEPHKDTTALSGENCSWTVRSYVDAQNSFGAMIRSQWMVKLKLIGMDSYNNPKWLVTDIEVK